MLWRLLLRHVHAALRPAPIRHARTHAGRLGTGVIANLAQPAIAAFNVKGLDDRPGQAVVFDGLGLGAALACGEHRHSQLRKAPLV